MTAPAVLVGIVTDLSDPDRLGRIRVRYPNYDDQLSNWVRIASPMAGKGRGFRFTPELGDEVLVAHEHCDMRRPYLLGALWSSADTPPSNDGDDKANNWRFFTSRSGHLLKFDDTSGGEKIEIIDKDGALRVVIDSAASKVEVTADKGDVDVSAPAGAVTVNAKTIELKATTNITIDATGTLTLKGATVQIN